MTSEPPLWADASAGTLPWLAVAGYLVGAALCLRQTRSAATRRERLFWLFAGFAMLALGINKQLDLQTALTAWGRQMARDGGWFAERRAVQRQFILVGMVTMAIGAIGLAWMVRGLRAPVFVVLAGLYLLGVFALVRAASFHHIDLAMRAPVFGLKLHTVFELAGIAVVITGAGRSRQR